MDKTSELVGVSLFQSGFFINEMKFDGNTVSFRIFELPEVHVATIYLDDVVAHRMVLDRFRMRSDSLLSTWYAINELNDSDFVKWIHDESYDVWKTDGVRHFVITDFEWVADVLAVGEPRIDWVLKPDTAGN